VLEGFNYSLTPRGRSTPNPLPPWYYSSDFLLKEPVTDGSLSKQRPIVNLLHYPRLAADMRNNKPALHGLVENVPHDVKIEQAWIGNGSLTLPMCRGGEISDLAPLHCGMGLRASMGYVVDDLKTLMDLRV
jgi:hypothetical protein